MSTSVLSSNLKYQAGALKLDGVALDKLARRFGTPLYVYSEQTIKERYDALEGALKGVRHTICYAMKANSNRALCAILARLGAGADVVSGGELQRALRAGFKPENIVFAGVGKTLEELTLAIRKGIKGIHVESEEELNLINRIATRLKRSARIAVRINPNVDAHTHQHIATGKSGSKFGVDPLHALKLYEKAAKERWLSLSGMHCHIGSQIRSSGPYNKTISVMLELNRALNAHGIYLDYLDAGGGLGISYDGEPGLALPEWAAAMRRVSTAQPQAELLIEPGRWLVADAGALITTVLYKKESRGARHLIVDAGMNDLIRPALYGAKHPIIPLTIRGASKKPWSVSGPICESVDTFARSVNLPTTIAGEHLAVLKAGAYGFSMSSQYNSRPRPAEILITKGQARVIRSRETLNDLTRGES